MQNLYLLEHLTETFWCHVHHYQYLAIPLELAVMMFIFWFSAIPTPLNQETTPYQPVSTGLPSIDNGAHGTEMLLLKIQVSENFA
jgi:hypothetical protein